MNILQFDDLVQKFGLSAAWHWLLEIEKAARIASGEAAQLDPQTRLDIACRTQDEQAAQGGRS